MMGQRRLVHTPSKNNRCSSPLEDVSWKHTILILDVLFWWYESNFVSRLHVIVMVFSHQTILVVLYLDRCPHKKKTFANLSSSGQTLAAKSTATILSLLVSSSSTVALSLDARRSKLAKQDTNNILQSLHE